MVQVMAQRPDEKSQSLKIHKKNIEINFSWPSTRLNFTNYFDWSKCIFAVLDHRIHCVCHRETVRPIVIWHSTIILFDGERETRQTMLIETMQSKQVGEHVDGEFSLFEIIVSERVEVVVIDIGYCIRYTAR